MTDKSSKIQESPTRIVVFQEHSSGEEKISGIKEFGKNIEIVKVVNIEKNLPEIVDDPESYIHNNFTGDLVLSFLKHPDLAEYLVGLCNKKNIPIIAKGTKIPGAITPFTCCGLGKHKGLGQYGAQFGFPEFEVKIRDGKISRLEVRRGASCGATWEIVDHLVGMKVEEALSAVAREAQYFCSADPSAFDPISGKSMLHYAGDVHFQALRKAIGGK